MNIYECAKHIKREMAKVIVGQEQAIEQMILAYLSGGHIILEGVPGLAKTMMARTFAKIIGHSFSRIQFTPDLLPTDISGTMIYNIKEGSFHFSPGPVFTNILLADEINRSSPKTQSALLEAMQEHQVTIDGKKHQLQDPFMVIATQNPIEFEGTYPLPEAQLDRFLMKVQVDYPSEAVELEIYKRFRDGFDSNALDSMDFEVLDLGVLENCRKQYSSIQVDDSLLNYIQQIILSSRDHGGVLLGASTRSGISLLTLARYRAALEGRDYMIPDDVKEMAKPVLRHRLVLEAESEIDGLNADKLVDQILKTVEAPH
jgi:MoxR-like ATPase